MTEQQGSDAQMTPEQKAQVKANADYESRRVALEDERTEKAPPDEDG